MTTKLQPPVEQITIRAGEMSWEDWQPHFERMSARDVCRFIERQDDDEINAFTVVMGDAFFPISLKQDFTYTPVYPAKVSEPETVDVKISKYFPYKPPLKLGQTYDTWEELEELVKAYRLTDENSFRCFKNICGEYLGLPVTLIEQRDTYLPVTLVKMPDVVFQIDKYTIQAGEQTYSAPMYMYDCDEQSIVPAPEPLKHYVWVEGNRLPSKPHDTRQEAVNEALRLAQKESKMAIVCTDIIKPVTRAEIVELEKG